MALITSDNQQSNLPQQNHSQVLVKEIRKYLNYWYLIVLSLILSLIVLTSALRYVTNQYESRINIKIVDQTTKETVNISNMLGGGKSGVNLDNEKEGLKSFRLSEKIVRQLNLCTYIYSKGYFKSVEMWDDAPFIVTFTDSVGLVDNRSFSMKININKGGYTRSFLEGTFDQQQFEFGKVYAWNGLNYRIDLKPRLNTAMVSGTSYVVTKITMKEAVESLAGSLDVNPASKQGDVLTIKVIGPIKKKSEDILNALVNEYNKDGMADRQLIYKNTINFVNDRLNYLYNELDSIETGIESYLVNNDMISIDAEAAVTAGKKYGTEERIVALEGQIEMAKYLDKLLRFDGNSRLLPENIGVENANINDIINTYNNVVLERSKLSASAGDNNPAVKQLNARVEELQANAMKSLRNYQAELTLQLQTLQRLQSANNAKFRQVPAKEKALRSIERKQSIKESLYLVLLQKREEAAINLASTTPSVKFLDDATSMIDPISPNRKMLYTIAVLLGLGLPIGFLFLVFKLDTKVRNSDDVTSASPRIPLIAEIPRVAEQKKQVTKHDNSPLAEAFRILRTNINFMLPVDLQGKAPVIMVTSTIKGEGKTFNSRNLSFVYATTNKRVLLIGSDLRNPQLHKYLQEVKSLGGLSDYLHDPEFKWKDHVLEKVLDNTHLDILLSGSVPPNPAELLTNGRFELLLNEAKTMYDYIIVDTAPSLLVTDTMLIAHLADLIVYVTSVKVTEKRLINYSKELKDSGKFNNVAYVLNNVIQPSFSYKYGYKYGYSYNYGYGYGYGQDKDQVKRPWWQFWRK